MVLENEGLTLSATDVEAGTNEGVIESIHACDTKKGNRFIANVKMNDNRFYAVWLGFECVRKIAQYVRDTKKAEEGLKLTFVLRTYTNKDGTEGKSPAVDKVE